MCKAGISDVYGIFPGSQAIKEYIKQYHVSDERALSVLGTTITDSFLADSFASYCANDTPSLAARGA